MKNKKLFQKVVFIALILAVIFSFVAPAIFSQETLRAPKEEKLLNGLKVLMWPDPAGEDVQVRIRIHAGAAFDPQGKEGVMQLLADGIFPSDAQRDFFKEDLGGSLEIVTTYDFIQINASSKPDQMLTMLETLATAVSGLAIDKEITASLKNAHVKRLQKAELDSVYVADHAAAARLLGTFPYGRSMLGTQASLAKLDFADLIEARGRFFTADNATIALSGKFDQSLAFRAVRRFFGGWLKSDKRVPTAFRQPEKSEPAMLTVVSPFAEHPEVRIAIRGFARSDPDYMASKALAKILKTRLSTTGPREAVTRINVTHEGHVQPGLLVISYTVSPAWMSSGDKPATRLQTFSADAGKRVVTALISDITDSEFAIAKAEAQMEMTRKTTADWFLDSHTFALGSAATDYKALQNLSLADVKRAAARLAKNPAITVVVAKPAE
ncbi:MAG: insulinase family protein [Pyrinomonadaceae bacterium]